MIYPRYPLPRRLRLMLALISGLGIAAPLAALDLQNAVVVTSPEASPRQKQAIRMLVEEVEKRTGILWPQLTAWPQSNAPVIAVGLEGAAGAFAGPYAGTLAASATASAPEGFRLGVRPADQSPAVLVLGHDERGVLFGVGRLLRELHMSRGKVSVDDNLAVATAPKYALRGHQLGYRPKTHSYDAWDLPVWEQYFRDLAVFGCNTVELIPPRSDDDADSPHFPRPPMEMMQGMSRLADAYGLDVWVWYPAMDKNYASPRTVKSALREWGEVFARLPRIDAVFVPGGDPGHTQPKYLMALLEKQTENLHRYHPRAQMWVSPQGFTQAWLDEFVDILHREQPAWLTGVVYGPQVRVSLEKLRALVPAKYPIRDYPDITHSRQCQYPVPNWDAALAVTEGRECINPRPVDHAIIFRQTAPHTIGFLTYSEGCNDDVNKCIWSALGWEPDADVTEVLRQFSRYFIGEPYTDDFARGLLALEQNWRGPLRANRGVDQTLEWFQAMEKRATPDVLKNWRFQQALFRAYFDASVRQRLLFESDLESRALAFLHAAPETGSARAMADAERTLNQFSANPANEPLRQRVFQLAEDLYQSIRMQLSVEKYRAIDVGRGASLDTLDFALNNRLWLRERFGKIRALPSETERLAALARIVEWTNPGPGGFYDDLGNSAAQPHLDPGPGFAADPGCFQSPRVDFAEYPMVKQRGRIVGTTRRVSWTDHAEALYDGTLKLTYPDLDPSARYKVRVTYAGDNQKKIRLVANDGIEIHPYRAKSRWIEPLEFPVPPTATRTGRLTLIWNGEPGRGGNGRDCQVSEVWLLKESPPPPEPANPPVL